MTVTQAVILCGGFGTRMGSLVKDTPKPMLPIADVPLLQRTIEHLERHGITDIILCAHYKAEVIEQYFSALGKDVTVLIEEVPLGTAGPLRLAQDRLHETFLVVYGDEFLDFDITALVQEHERHRPVLTILARPSHHPWDGHLIQTERDGRVTEFVRAFDIAKGHKNLGNLGVYVCDRRILQHIPEGKSGFAEDVFPALLASDEPMYARVIESSGYVKDVGNPGRIAEVETYLRRREAIERARVQRKPLQAAFIDRDGVIVKDTGLIRSPDELQLLPGAARAISLLNSAGIRTIVVTNQPQIARGLITEEQLAGVHDRLREMLSAEGAHLDAIYYCPHHPETQHNEGVLELRRGCDCRKPRPGMLLQAAEDLGVDLGASVIIGDSSDDIEAGHNAGVRTVLVETGNGRLRADAPRPDRIYAGPLETVQELLAERALALQARRVD